MEAILDSEYLNTSINYKLTTINFEETTMVKAETRAEILKLLLRGLNINPVVTSLAKETGLSRVGAWKVLKKLEEDSLVSLPQLGEGETSARRASMNWDNPLTEKELALALTEEAMENRRWLANFAELEGRLEFLLIYGSAIRSPKEANDIDILGVVRRKGDFEEIEKRLHKIQKTQLKKLHALNFTEAELKEELEKPNEALVDAVRTGVVLFGQENFIRFMRKVKRR